MQRQGESDRGGRVGVVVPASGVVAGTGGVVVDADAGAPVVVVAAVGERCCC